MSSRSPSRSASSRSRSRSRSNSPSNRSASGRSASSRSGSSRSAASGSARSASNRSASSRSRSPSNRSRSVSRSRSPSNRSAGSARSASNRSARSGSARSAASGSARSASNRSRSRSRSNSPSNRSFSDRSGSNRSRSRSASLASVGAAAAAAAASRSRSRSVTRSRSASGSRSPSRRSSRSGSRRSVSGSRSPSRRSSRSGSRRSRSRSSRSPSRRSSRSASKRSAGRSVGSSRRSSRSPSSRSPSRSSRRSSRAASLRDGKEPLVVSNAHGSALDDGSYYSRRDDDYADADFPSPAKEWYCSLPEPAAISHKDYSIPESQFLSNLQTTIDTLSAHIRGIQEEEARTIEAFVKRVQTFGTRVEQEKEQEIERRAFVDQIAIIRESRREHRALLYDAIMERNNLLREGYLQHRQRLEIIERQRELNPEGGLDWIIWMMFLLQILMILLFLIFINFPSNFTFFEVSNPLFNSSWSYPIPQGAFAFTTRDVQFNPNFQYLRGDLRYSDTIHTYSIEMALVIFVGFALFISRLRRSIWSGMAFALLVGAFAIEAIFILNGFLVWAANSDFQKIFLTPVHYLEALYAAAAVIISLGAVIGQLPPIGIFFMVIIEIILYAVNLYIGAGVLDAKDYGRAIFTYVFASLFGVVVSFIVSFRSRAKYDEYYNWQSSYFSDILTFVGTCLIFALFPAMNTSYGVYWNANITRVRDPLDLFSGSQYRAIINTVLGECASAVVAYALTHFTLGCFRMDILQSAVIAGGIALASIHNVLIHPWGALLIGAIAGALTFLGVRFLQKGFARMRLIDSRHIFSTFFLPGTLGAVAGIISLAIYFNDFNWGGQSLAALGNNQRRLAVRQLGAWLISMAMALVGGLITGLLLAIFGKAPGIRRVFHKYEAVDTFNDGRDWVIPADLM